MNRTLSAWCVFGVTWGYHIHGPQSKNPRPWDVPARLVIEVDLWAIVQVTSCRTLVELMRNEREMLVFAYDPLSKYIKYPLSKP